MLYKLLSSALKSLLKISRAVALFAAATGLPWVLISPLSLPAWAEEGIFTVNLSPYRAASLASLMSAAESLASGELSRQFRQNLDLTTVQITVLGEYNGQVVPVLVATVSRENWQRSPQVRQWASYFNSSYVLLGFNSDPTGADRDAIATNDSPGLNISPAIIDPIEQLVEAAEKGELSDAELIELIDALD